MSAYLLPAESILLSGHVNLQHCQPPARKARRTVLRWVVIWASYIVGPCRTFWQWRRPPTCCWLSSTCLSTYSISGTAHLSSIQVGLVRQCSDGIKSSPVIVFSCCNSLIAFLLRRSVLPISINTNCLHGLNNPNKHLTLSYTVTGDLRFFYIHRSFSSICPWNRYVSHLYFMVSQTCSSAQNASDQAWMTAQVLEIPSFKINNVVTKRQQLEPNVGLHNNYFNAMRYVFFEHALLIGSNLNVTTFLPLAETGWRPWTERIWIK